MKVLHITASDHGGAGRAAHRLHLSMRAAGIDSHMCAFDKRSGDMWTTRIRALAGIFVLRRFLSKVILKVLTIPDYRFSWQDISLGISAESFCAQLGMSPDIIVVHYISGFLSFQDVLQLQRLTNARVIWNLLDMGGFTGGCHYAWSCHGYEAKCGRCPALRMRSESDLSARVLERKRRTISAMDLTVVAGSTLLRDQARNSIVFGDRQINTILIGIDPETFRQRNREEARRLLGLSTDKRTIFFGAQSSKDRRKGHMWLVKALQQLAEMTDFDHSSVQILSIGKVDDSPELAAAGIIQNHLGLTDDESQLVLAYQASDVLACPSVQDSGPTMINESLMCGTPVVAFHMGVATDLICGGQTGYIARLMDTNEFAAGLRRFLELDENERTVVSDRCRNLAFERCNAAVQAQKYVTVMKKLCEGNVDSSNVATNEVD